MNCGGKNKYRYGGEVSKPAVKTSCSPKKYKRGGGVKKGRCAVRNAR